MEERNVCVDIYKNTDRIDSGVISEIWTEISPYRFLKGRQKYLGIYSESMDRMNFDTFLTIQTEGYKILRYTSESMDRRI
jgi:hypothetical protein